MTIYPSVFVAHGSSGAPMLYEGPNEYGDEGTHIIPSPELLEAFKAFLFAQFKKWSAAFPEDLSKTRPDNFRVRIWSDGDGVDFFAEDSRYGQPYEVEIELRFAQLCDIDAAIAAEREKRAEAAAEKERRHQEALRRQRRSVEAEKQAKLQAMVDTLTSQGYVVTPPTGGADAH